MPRSKRVSIPIDLYFVFLEYAEYPITGERGPQHLHYILDLRRPLSSISCFPSTARDLDLTC